MKRVGGGNIRRPNGEFTIHVEHHIFRRPDIELCSRPVPTV